MKGFFNKVLALLPTAALAAVVALLLSKHVVPKLPEALRRWL